MPKFKLHVIWGSEASERAADVSPRAAICAINRGDIDGAYATYSFSSEKDLLNAVQLLNDGDGWMECYWETKYPSTPKKQNT